MLRALHGTAGRLLPRSAVEYVYITDVIKYYPLGFHTRDSAVVAGVNLYTRQHFPPDADSFRHAFSVRYGGASGQLTMRADSGFYTHAVVAVCRRMDVRFSITIRQHKSLHNLIEAIPEDAWTPIPYWMDGAAHHPAGAAHARLPTGSLRHLQLSRLHHRPGRRNPGTGG